MRAIKKATVKSQQNQQLILSVVGVLFVLILLYQFFWRSAAPGPLKEVSADQHSPGRYKASELKNHQDQAPQPSTDAQAASQQPALDLEHLPWQKNGELAVNRNLFVYPPPPPPPPAPPPPPPTVPISAISPSSVYAQTAPFELSVRGAKFTPEMRIYLNGNALLAPTKFVNENELCVTVPQSSFSSAQQLRVEVRQPGQEKDLFSNPMTLSVLQPPQPTFTMLGRMSESSGENPQAILTEKEQDSEKRSVVALGANFLEKASNTTWKVVNIGPNFIEVEDVSAAKGVRHTVSMKEQAGGGGITTAFTPAYTPPQPVVEQPVEAVPEIAVEQPPNGPTPNPNPNRQNMEEILKQRREEIMRRRQEYTQQQGNQGGNSNPGLFGNPGLIRPRN